MFRSGQQDAPECQRYGNVPFENEVFVGDSPQDMHGEYENTQLRKFQKIEVHKLFLILFIVYRGTAPTKISLLFKNNIC